jgi:TatD DNase family protein
MPVDRPPSALADAPTPGDGVPAPARPAWIDIGVNLTDRRFAIDQAAVVARAAGAGVQHIVVTGTDLAHSRAATALCERMPTALSCCVGVHPHVAAAVGDELVPTLRTLAGARGVRAIGETGLDYDRDFSPRPRQRAVFAAQLALAAELQLPVFVHDRASAGDVAAMLREFRSALVDVVVHCFTGTGDELEALLELDCHIGITGWVCDERRGTALAALVPRIPDDRLLLETDAPWLVPRTLRPRPSRNEPALLPEIGRVVAGLRGCDTRELAVTTTANARRFFRLDAG